MKFVELGSIFLTKNASVAPTDTGILASLTNFMRDVRRVYDLTSC